VEGRAYHLKGSLATYCCKQALQDHDVLNYE
jgi:hypothetical protein